MKRVKITLYLEATDPDHSTGLTEKDYEDVTRRLMSVGADDYEIEVEDDYDRNST
jgi:hypothetical protein